MPKETETLCGLERDAREAARGVDRLTPRGRSTSRRTSQIAPDAPARHAERSARYPERSARYPERSTRNPERSTRNPERSTRHPETSAKHGRASWMPWRRSRRHPEASPRHRDVSPTHGRTSRMPWRGSRRHPDPLVRHSESAPRHGRGSGRHPDASARTSREIAHALEWIRAGHPEVSARYHAASAGCRSTVSCRAHRAPAVLPQAPRAGSVTSS
jgi:hypothetical protein